jgi:DNA-binding GntR family transcriptional regulator
MDKNNIKSALTELFSIHQKTIDAKIGENYKNLGDRVYEIVKNKIICHEIKPGERIIDNNLAEELGVSRSLVRQALNILEKEELITLIPRSGFYVREITKKDVEEIYDIRKLLETYATELAVPRIPEKVILETERMFEEAKKDLEKNKVNKFVEADVILHKMTVNHCGNERLIKMINSYNNHYIFYRIIDLARVERAKEAYFEHYDIFKAVKDRDVKVATELMGNHIENAKNIILENFEKYTFG